MKRMSAQGDAKREPVLSHEKATGLQVLAALQQML